MRWSCSRLAVSSLAAAAEDIAPGSNVFVHTAMMAPTALLDQLVGQRSRFSPRLNLYHLHTDGSANYLHFPDQFHSTAFFCAANDRAAVNDGTASFVPIFLSEVSSLWKSGRLPLDYALVSVSPPDRHGIVSLGTSVDVSLSAVHHAKKTIAVVNRNVPRVHGDGLVHVSRFHRMVECDAPLPLHEKEAIGETEQKVGEQVAALIPDGATLQMGIGQIPDAVLGALTGHKNLGVHSEMFSDGVIDLVKRGVVTNALKNNEPFQTVGSFVVGSQRVIDFVHDNPAVKLMRSSYVNDPHLIREIDNMHAINSLIQIDLTGQVCADSIGKRIWSGIGGQMDFVRGASLSKGGKAIMAFTSRTGKGISRIVPVLAEGAGVTVTRNHTRFVVTEYGAADLFGMNLRERARALVAIAHPDDRAMLEKAAFERFK